MPTRRTAKAKVAQEMKVQGPPKTSVPQRVLAGMDTLVEAYPAAVALALSRTDSINAAMTAWLHYARTYPELLEPVFTALLNDLRPGVRKCAQAGLLDIQRYREGK